jgi:hypothetical protein
VRPLDVRLVLEDPALRQVGGALPREQRVGRCRAFGGSDRGVEPVQIEAYPGPVEPVPARGRAHDRVAAGDAGLQRTAQDGGVHRERGDRVGRGTAGPQLVHEHCLRDHRAAFQREDLQQLPRPPVGKIVDPEHPVRASYDCRAEHTDVEHRAPLETPEPPRRTCWATVEAA